MRCRQFAAAPRGGLQLAEARAILPPSANRSKDMRTVCRVEADTLENDACDPSGPHAHKCFGLEKMGVVYYKVQYSFTSSAVMRSPLRIMRRSTTLRSSRILPLHGIAERASNASRSTSLRCMPCSSAILSTK